MMSKLYELINKMCPDGVPYKRLEDCCYLEKGRTPIQKAIPGKYPLVVTTSERKSSNSYQFDKPTVCVPLVSSRGHGVACLNAVYYQEGKFALGNILCGVTPFESSGLSAKFLYYYLNLEKDNLIVPLMKGGANVSLTVNALKTVKMPIPPIEIQEEVIRLIDKFEELIGALQEELETRKTQCEYYRNELLHLEGAHLTIDELFVTRNGFTPSKDNPEFWENGTLPWFKLDDINSKGRVLSESNLHITEKALKKSGLFSANSIIISTSATIGEYALITVPFLCNQRFTCLTLKPQYKDNVNIKYLMHYCPVLAEYCKGHLNQGNFASVDMKQFGKFEFVIPDLKEQERLVDILDRFSLLCNDTSIGIPAEIEARQKQYEYYRDRLLTFKELA